MRILKDEIIADGHRITEAMTEHVCSMMIQVETDDAIICKVNIIGGCAGNTQGVARLTEGRPINEVIPLIEHIDCGGKGTSCPDQLAQVLRHIANHPIH